MPPRNHDDDIREIFQRLNELERQSHARNELAKVEKEQMQENTVDGQRNREAILILQTKFGMVAGMFGIAGGLVGAIIGSAVKALLH